MAVKREGISKTVERLGDRIHETFDWRIHVARHPYVALAAAAGVGLWVSGLFKPSRTLTGRVLDAVSDTVEEVTRSLRESTRDDTSNGAAPTTVKALLGLTVANAGIAFLAKKVSEALPAPRTPTNGTRTR
jgi:hypothetical protein